MKVRKKERNYENHDFLVTRGVHFDRFPSHLLLWLSASHKQLPDPDRRPELDLPLDPVPLPDPNLKLNPKLESLMMCLHSTSVNLLMKKNPADRPEKLGLNPKCLSLLDLPSL